MNLAIGKLAPRSKVNGLEQMNTHPGSMLEVVPAGANAHDTNGHSANSHSVNAAEQGLHPATMLLADDCAVTRRGVRALVESQQGWRVVAEAASGREAIAKAVQLRPDVIILSVTMRELNGLDATRLILKSVPHARILVLTSYQTEEMIQRALRAGVRGYVLKSDAEADLVAAVKALLEGRTFFTSIASEVIVDRLRRDRDDVAHSALTVREAEIVQLLAEGNSNKQVAGILSISSRTVENHRAQIMQRLGLGSFSGLIRYAIRVGIVEP